MSKQSQIATTATATKTQQPKPAPAATQEMVAVPELTEVAGFTGQAAFQTDVNRLGNPNLQRLQRQMVANRIGQTHGNGHLQQVVAFARQNAPYQSNSGPIPGKAIVQRAPQPVTEEAEEMVSDEALTNLWGGNGGLTTAAPIDPPPPQNGRGGHVQRKQDKEEATAALESAAPVETPPAPSANAVATTVDSVPPTVIASDEAGQTEQTASRAPTRDAATAQSVTDATQTQPESAPAAAASGTDNARSDEAITQVAPLKQAATGATDPAVTPAVADTVKAEKQTSVQKQQKLRNKQQNTQSTAKSLVAAEASERLVLQDQIGNAAVQRLLAQHAKTEVTSQERQYKPPVAIPSTIQKQPIVEEAGLQAQAQAQWVSHPNIHRYFGNQLATYQTLLPLYQARGIVNPAHYIVANIVQVSFFGRNTPAHWDMAGPLTAAENTLKKQNITPEINRFWSFKVRPTSDGTLSQHAAGRAVDINALENPHVKHAIDIEVIAAVTGVNLGQHQEADDLRQASETFQQDFTQEWIDQQTPELQRQIRRRRAALDQYAATGFLNLEQSLIDALVAADFSWGGGWNGSKDFMHFELGWEPDSLVTVRSTSSVSTPQRGKEVE